MKQNAQEKVRASLETASRYAKDWFMKESTAVLKADWKTASCAAKNLRNIVYAFFDDCGACIYVGVSKAELKKRVHYKTSPHAKQPWWKKWKSLNVIEIPDPSDRLFLEMLLIIALTPTKNKKPAGRNIGDAFKA